MSPIEAPRTDQVGPQPPGCAALHVDVAIVRGGAQAVRSVSSL